MLLPGFGGQKNGPWYTKSLLFQGTDDVVSFGEPSDLTLDWSANELTMSCWIRPTAIGGVMDVMGKAQPFALPTPLIAVLMGISADGRLFGYFGGNTHTTQSASASQISANTWYHIALTIRNISGTQTGNIWLNGVKQGSDVTGISTETSAGKPFRIGGSYVLNAPDVARAYSGYVALPVTFSKGLIQAEVQELMQGNKPLAPKQHSQSSFLTHLWGFGNFGDVYPTMSDKIGSAPGTCANMAGAGTNVTTVVP